MISVEKGKVTKIERGAENVLIPQSIVSIGQYVFAFASIKSLHLEETKIIIIEKYAFAHCYYLEELFLPASLEEISEGAFLCCKNIKNISIPLDSKLRIIGKRAFNGCTELNQFIFPPLIESIGKFSFDKCHRLESLDLGKTRMKTFGRITTFYSKDLTIMLPPTASVTSIIKNYRDNFKLDESHSVVKFDECGYYMANRIIYRMKSKSSHVRIRRCYEKIDRDSFSSSNLTSVTIPSFIVTISKRAFYSCKNLRNVQFCKDSRLKKIGKWAFYGCTIDKIRFPKSLKIIKTSAFFSCLSLKKAIFPPDSELERIEDPFYCTAIKHLSLPSSVNEISFDKRLMFYVHSIHISSENYQSNDEGTAVFSKDRSELICVVSSLKHFEIPDCVRVIKKRAFVDSSVSKLIIPPSIEVIEDEIFHSIPYSIVTIEFSAGSRLKYLGLNSLPNLNNLIINNENFATLDNGVVMSLEPRGIVFVPRDLTELEIDTDVEVIYSYAFCNSNIETLKLPKRLKKIGEYAFENAKVSYLTFDEIELDFFDKHAFSGTNFRHFKFPLIKGEIKENFEFGESEIIEFPPNFNFKCYELPNDYSKKKIICPRSSIQVVAEHIYGS